MSEQRDGEARVKDDPLTCSKCGGPTRENGRWHPDLGAVFGYELGLSGNYCCDGLWDWRNRPAPPQPVASEEDRARVRRIKEIIGNADWPPDAGDDAKALAAVLNDATTLASQHSEERGK